MHQDREKKVKPDTEVERVRRHVEFIKAKIRALEFATRQPSLISIKSTGR